GLPSTDTYTNAPGWRPRSMPSTSDDSAPGTAAAPLPSMINSATERTLTVMAESGGAMMGTMDDGAPDPEPDVQLSFANERTFLAWERTALGLITAGLAIT